MLHHMDGPHEAKLISRTGQGHAIQVIPLRGSDGFPVS
jgi:hypothetical protein